MSEGAQSRWETAAEELVKKVVASADNPNEGRPPAYEVIAYVGRRLREEDCD